MPFNSARKETIDMTPDSDHSNLESQYRAMIIDLKDELERVLQIERETSVKFKNLERVNEDNMRHILNLEREIDSCKKLEEINLGLVNENRRLNSLVKKDNHSDLARKVDELKQNLDYYENLVKDLTEINKKNEIEILRVSMGKNQEVKPHFLEHSGLKLGNNTTEEHDSKDQVITHLQDMIENLQRENDSAVKNIEEKSHKIQELEKKIFDLNEKNFHLEDHKMEHNCYSFLLKLDEELKMEIERNERLYELLKKIQKSQNLDSVVIELTSEILRVKQEFENYQDWRTKNDSLKELDEILRLYNESRIEIKNLRERIELLTNTTFRLNKVKSIESEIFVDRLQLLQRENESLRDEMNEPKLNYSDVYSTIEMICNLKQEENYGENFDEFFSDLKVMVKKFEIENKLLIDRLERTREEKEELLNWREGQIFNRQSILNMKSILKELKSTGFESPENTQALAAARNEISTLTKEIQQRDRKLEELAKRYETTQNENISLLRSSVKLSQSDMIKSPLRHTKIEELDENKLKNLKDELACMTRVKDKIFEKLDRTRIELAYSNEEKMKIEQRIYTLETMNQDLEAKVGEMGEEHEIRMAEFQKKLMKSKARVIDLEKINVIINPLKTENLELKRIISNLKEEIKIHKHNYEKFRNEEERQDKEIQRLKSFLSKLKEKYEELRSEYIEEKNLLAELKQKLNLKSDECRELEDQCSLFRINIEELSKEVRTYKQKLKNEINSKLSLIEKFKEIQVNKIKKNAKVSTEDDVWSFASPAKNHGDSLKEFNTIENKVLKGEIEKLRNHLNSIKKSGEKSKKKNSILTISDENNKKISKTKKFHPLSLQSRDFYDSQELKKLSKIQTIGSLSNEEISLNIRTQEKKQLAKLANDAMMKNENKTKILKNEAEGNEIEEGMESIKEEDTSNEYILQETAKKGKGEKKFFEEKNFKRKNIKDIVIVNSNIVKGKLNFDDYKLEKSEVVKNEKFEVKLLNEQILKESKQSKQQQEEQESREGKFELEEKVLEISEFEKNSIEKSYSEVAKMIQTKKCRTMITKKESNESNFEMLTPQKNNSKRTLKFTPSPSKPHSGMKSGSKVNSISNIHESLQQNYPESTPKRALTDQKFTKLITPQTEKNDGYLNTVPESSKYISNYGSDKEVGMTEIAEIEDTISEFSGTRKVIEFDNNNQSKKIQQNSEKKTIIFEKKNSDFANIHHQQIMGVFDERIKQVKSQILEYEESTEKKQRHNQAVYQNSMGLGASPMPYESFGGNNNFAYGRSEMGNKRVTPGSPLLEGQNSGRRIIITQRTIQQTPSPIRWGGSREARSANLNQSPYSAVSDRRQNSDFKAQQSFNTPVKEVRRIQFDNRYIGSSGGKQENAWKKLSESNKKKFITSNFGSSSTHNQIRNVMMEQERAMKEKKRRETISGNLNYPQLSQNQTQQQIFNSIQILPKPHYNYKERSPDQKNISLKQVDLMNESSPRSIRSKKDPLQKIYTPGSNQNSLRRLREGNSPQSLQEKISKQIKIKQHPNNRPLNNNLHQIFNPLQEYGKFNLNENNQINLSLKKDEQQKNNSILSSTQPGNSSINKTPGGMGLFEKSNKMSTQTGNNTVKKIKSNSKTITNPLYKKTNLDFSDNSDFKIGKFTYSDKSKLKSSQKIVKDIFNSSNKRGNYSGGKNRIFESRRAYGYDGGKPSYRDKDDQMNNSLSVLSSRRKKKRARSPYSTQAKNRSFSGKRKRKNLLDMKPNFDFMNFK